MNRGERRGAGRRTRADAGRAPEYGGASGFRAAVLVPAVGDPILGSPACAVPRCVHSSRYGGLCLAHLARWKQAGRPDRREWAQTADPAVMGHRPLQPCLVAECGFGQHRYQLCYKHSQLWGQTRAATTGSVAPGACRGTDAGVCATGVCVVGGTGWGWCRSHHVRWRLRGRPPTAEFIAYCASYGEDRFDLRALPPALRLEIGYGLQCRVDAKTDPHHAAFHQAAAGSSRQRRRVAVGASAD